MKKILFSLFIPRLPVLLLGTTLLVSCASQKRVGVLERLQSDYTNVVNLNERYLHDYYGKPDPVSFPRLQRYKSEAYQALMEFRKQFDKNKPIPQQSLQNAKEKIGVYRSYLNALGATSATKDNFTGF